MPPRASCPLLNMGTGGYALFGISFLYFGSEDGAAGPSC
jgi:hypothetical protein